MPNPGLDLFLKLNRGILEIEYSVNSVGADPEVFQVRSCIFLNPALKYIRVMLIHKELYLGKIR